MGSVFFKKILFITASAILLGGCAQLEYYSQSIAGQWEIISISKPIDKILLDENVPDSVKEKLSVIQEIRGFATEELNLPDNNSYLSFADINREYVVWNIIATPKLSLEPLQWCYPIAGCLDYRGFFNKDDALNQANKLQEEGYDVFIGGVSAYSTLGWFDDPVLNTMLKKDLNYLVKVIFHELAHQKNYIRNDTEFNEAFAETVAITGTRKWLSIYRSKSELEEFNRNQDADDKFVSIVLNARKELEKIYNSNLPDQLKLQIKSQILANMREEYKSTWSYHNTETNYDEWFENDINNAKITIVATYRNLIPGFIQLLEYSGNNYDSFYHLVKAMEQCSLPERRTILATGDIKIQC